MPSRTARPPDRRSNRQPEYEDPYGHIPQPKQSHLGYLAAFLSVIAVLAFGFWTALGTATSTGEKSAAPSTPAGTSAAKAATTAPTAQVVVPPTSAPAASPAATRAATAAPGSGRVHVVGEGDTLYRIAQRYGTTVEAIMQANGFTDRSKILHIGDRLTIP